MLARWELQPICRKGGKRGGRGRGRGRESKEEKGKGEVLEEEEVEEEREGDDGGRGRKRGGGGAEEYSRYPLTIVTFGRRPLKFSQDIFYVPENQFAVVSCAAQSRREKSVSRHIAVPL